MANTVHIFDFDYTLFKTVENVFIWSPRGNYFKHGKPCIRLDSQDYLNYSLCDDEYVNDLSFSEFNSVDFIRAKPIYPTLSIFKSVKNKIILSARPQCVGDQIKKNLIGDYDFIGLDSGDAEKKIKILKSIKTKNLILYDDSKKVIDLCDMNLINRVFVKSFKNNEYILNYKFY